MTEGKIENPRSAIDEIDRELLLLLNKRAAIALQVGEAKSSNALSLCDPEREQDVLARLQAQNRGPLDNAGIANIFHRIIDESLNLQQMNYKRFSRPTGDASSEVSGLTRGSRVAVLGDRGTFSEEAALRIFGDNCVAVSFPTFDELFTAIDTDSADLILAPLENSLIGSVHRCVDLLLDSKLNMIAEAYLPVSHFLIACPDAAIDTIKTVESHPAALAQCRRFFAAHPHVQAVPAEDTAGSVRRAVESGDPTRAGIGGRRAADIYGGKILREHIEDHPDNFTRFALLANDAEPDPAGTKISLVIKLRHEPGSLHNALRPFVRRGIDLLKIESLPIRSSPGHFNFYLDLSAPEIEGDLVGALADISEIAASVRYLGRYPTVKLETTD